MLIKAVAQTLVNMVDPPGEPNVGEAWGIKYIHD